VIEVGDAVRTPEGWYGEVKLVERQAAPLGGLRAAVGIAAKRARPGEYEAALAARKLYAVVVLVVPREHYGKHATYNVETLVAVGPEQTAAGAGGPE
jgi:hypothetical protein